MKILVERKKVYAIYILVMILCIIYCKPSIGLIFDVIIDSLIVTVFSYAPVISDKLNLVKDWKTSAMNISHGYVKYAPYVLTIGFVNVSVICLIGLIKTANFETAGLFLPTIESFYASKIMYQKFEESR